MSEVSYLKIPLCNGDEYVQKHGKLEVNQDNTEEGVTVTISQTVESFFIKDIDRGFSEPSS